MKPVCSRRRIASLGWGAFYSILLHFIIILTDRRRLLQKKRAYLLLYFPAAVTVFSFGLYGKIAVTQYHLFYTDTGWVNVSEWSGWDVWFILYYGIFSVACIGLVLSWGLLSKDRLIRKQSIMIGAALAFAILAGTLTEFVINSVYPVSTPQVAPVIALVPMMLMLFCIKRYRLLPMAKGDRAEAGKILSEANRTTLYRYLMLAYVFGAFINFAAQYFRRHESLDSALLFSAAMIILGFVLQGIQHIKIRTAYRDMLSDLLMAVTIPIAAYKYIDRSAFYILVVPVAFLLLSVAFDRKRMLYLTGAVTAATLLLMWIAVPEQLVGFTAADHLIRILFFLEKPVYCVPDQPDLPGKACAV